jgi:ribosomal protein S18 acetylase RimI-like enzyme
MRVREARLDDAGPLASLATQLGYPTTPDQAERRAIVGWIHVMGSVSLDSDPSAEIAGLVVDEVFRGSGIGARLVAEAEAWAEAGGYDLLRVRSNVKRVRARRFYERQGFELTKSQNNFVKSLEGTR